MHILFIDDFAHQTIHFLRALTLRIPELQAAEWHTAETGAVGLRLVTERPFNLVLMDGSLGNREYGYQVVQSIRVRGYTVPICMFSSDNDQNRLGLEAGADYAVNKSLFSLPEPGVNPEVERRELIRIITSCMPQRK
jgi:DNA-binding response OmpR family regulator